MELLLWIALGALAGWLASLIMKTNAQQGALMNIIVGVIGAVVGGLLMNLIGFEGVTGFNIWSIVVATLGAVVLIWAVRAIA
jgi:uncharacterized membrane protein YeaQ/YmgE (transglycosylase-associated protein family)